MEILNTDEKRMWREYCAVVQLPVAQFLDIQEALLSEQLDLVAEAPWAKAFVEGRPPKTIEDFRDRVPLHPWSDYAEHLQPERSDGFVGDTHCWVQTSWCHGSWKRVPWTRRFFDAQCRNSIAALMMSVARFEGDVRIDKNFRVLPLLPGTPFASAWLATGVAQRDVVSDRLAPQEGDASLSMSMRMQAMLSRSLDSGVDCVVGMGSTLLLARREFDKMVAKAGFRQIISRVGAGTALKWIASNLPRLARVKHWEPQALLTPKSIITWGADTSVITPTLESQWGAPVFQLYASSEGGVMAMQDWRRQGLIPIPTSVFLEFLPAGAPPDKDALVLLNELKDGELYEPVITSFYGMPFLRLRQGDLLQVVGRNEQGVPMFNFHSRADGIIDLGSIARIDHATLAEALEMVGLQDGEWEVQKEVLNGKPVMCLYTDIQPEDAEGLRRKLHRALGQVDPHYREASFTLAYPLLKVYPKKMGAPSANGAGRH